MKIVSEKWNPPRQKPWNESAGYLGYYTRTFLPVVFDLVDLDGYWPAVWIYFKKRNQEVRIFEEKPGQQMLALHDSQMRILRDYKTFAAHAKRFVIWQAERLAVPEFPIRITQIGNIPSQDQEYEFDREEFDKWLLNEDEPPDWLIENVINHSRR